MNEKHVALPYRYGPHDGLCPNHRPTTVCKLNPGSLFKQREASVERLALFHYTTKSEEDFRIQPQRRGGINSTPKPQSFFLTWAKCAPLI